MYDSSTKGPRWKRHASRTWWYNHTQGQAGQSGKPATRIDCRRYGKRTYANYHSRKDFNGQFVIQSYDDNDSDVEADYAYVIFSLESAQPLYDYDVYVVGAFNDWNNKA